jgi:hypothetical protein
MSEKDDLKIHEAHERAELAHVERGLAPVSLTMAILAVLTAATSLLGHRAHTEVLLAQTKANFQKAELVGKATQQHADEVLIQMLSVLTPTNATQAGSLGAKLKREVDLYSQELEIVKNEEQRLEHESQQARRKANRLDVAELFCELALVLCSITLLTRQRPYWVAGMILGSLSLATSLFAFLSI